MRAIVIGIPTGAIDLVPARRSGGRRAASPTRILTAARLDGEADPDRDRAAVASGLHHDAGLPVGMARSPGRSETSTG